MWTWFQLFGIWYAIEIAFKKKKNLKRNTVFNHENKIPGNFDQMLRTQPGPLCVVYMEIYKEIAHKNSRKIFDGLSSFIKTGEMFTGKDISICATW